MPFKTEISKLNNYIKRKSWNKRNNLKLRLLCWMSWKILKFSSMRNVCRAIWLIFNSSVDQLTNSCCSWGTFAWNWNSRWNLKMKPSQRNPTRRPFYWLNVVWSRHRSGWLYIITERCRIFIWWRSCQTMVMNKWNEGSLSCSLIV